ncbi:MAG TPA: hypothetical protein VFM46_12295, partial [Pseudomonadales bacterium]|nr:hypothetical protein [Pseudomonadales bacterium]
MALRILFACFCLVIFHSSANAALKLPDVLQEWSGWVLRDLPEQACPMLTDGSQRLCIWYGGLEVNSAKEGASFEMKVSAFAKADVRIQLPGDETNWPKEVLLDGRVAAVIEENNLPYLLIGEGEHRISGKFTWFNAPQALTVPAQIALISLTHNGKQIANPIIQQGQLTLTEGAEQSLAPLPNSLTLRVYRKLAEAVPMRLETRIELDASGRAREVNLGRLLDSHLQLERIDSELPARVDGDGNLVVQLKSGSWQISTMAHYTGPIESAGPIKQADDNAFWPGDELWVYQPNPSIRSVSFTNLDSIDTQQTDLPAEWKLFTAWKLAQGDSLAWTTQSRGSENSQANKLHLTREAWLDFSAENWTVKDQIKGQLFSDWRLVMTPPYALGSVSRQDIPLVVIDYENGKGVELRNKNISLRAMSRISADDFNTHLGWSNDFETAQLNVNLPPGWSVFTASGVSSASPTWISKWNLWDIFWILLITVASARLLGVVWSVVALSVLVLNYHEPNAPVWIWMALLITAALIKVVNHSTWKKVFISLQAISALILALIAIPYAIQQIRQAIYPQLETSATYFSAENFDSFSGSTSVSGELAEPAASSPP